ncbi:MAG: ABC transporter permease [Candidatus Sericytochromatia bacterium]
MLRYIIKRLIQMVPLLIIISILSFGIIRMAEVFAKADPLTALKMNPSTTQATIEREIQRLGLNDPLYVRYGKWAINFVQGDMGESYFYKTPVSGLITERINNTLVMGLSSLVFTWLIAIPLGIYLAVRQYSFIDQLFSSLSYFFMGFPDFFLAILLLLFAASTGWFPISGMTSVNNNHMAKINSVYAGKYERNPKAFAKLSPDFQKYVQDTRANAEKDDAVKLMKNTLELDIKYGKSDKIEDSAKVLADKLPMIDKFPQDLSQKIQNDVKTSGFISKDVANQAFSELNKITYFTFSDKVSYVLKHFDRILYHYRKYIPDVLYHLVLPTITLSIISIAALQRRMRANLLDVLNDEYIRTARAKGLPENVVIYKHAVRNALNPMVTLLGFELAGLLSGAAFVEILFSWPGLGQMMLEALTGNDLNLVMAGLVLSCIMLLFGNLLSDLLLAVTDPRIKLEA